MPFTTRFYICSATTGTVINRRKQKDEQISKKNETNNVFSLNWEIPREKMAENYFKSAKIPDLKCNEDGKESDTSSDSSDSNSDSSSDSSSDDVAESNSSDSNSAGNNIFCVFGVWPELHPVHLCCSAINDKHALLAKTIFIAQRLKFNFLSVRSKCAHV